MKSREPAAWRAAVHAVLLAGAAALAAPAAAVPADSPAFAPPSKKPLLLSRKVVRELPGGAAIVATRRYRISFHPLADGWQVEGALVGSEIDVPPALAAIAAHERARSDDGLFPIRLDRSGRIIAAPAPRGLGREAVAGALGAAERVAGSANAASVPGFLAGIGAAAASPGGGQTHWPEALFLPHGLAGTTEQVFTLPDGSQGTLQVSLESVPAPDSATMGWPGAPSSPWPREPAVSRERNGRLRPRRLLPVLKVLFYLSGNARKSLTSSAIRRNGAPLAESGPNPGHCLLPRLQQ